MKTDQLPDKSRGNLLSGYWFVFPSNEGIVRAWGSTFSGLERIYVDDRVVSERRSVNRLNIHEFEAFGRSCAIEFKVISIMTGAMQCSMQCDEKPTHIFRSRIVFKSLSLLKLLLVWMLAFGALGAVAAYYDVPLHLLKSLAIVLAPFAILTITWILFRWYVRIEMQESQEPHRGA